MKYKNQKNITKKELNKWIFDGDKKLMKGALKDYKNRALINLLSLQETKHSKEKEQELRSKFVYGEYTLIDFLKDCIKKNKNRTLNIITNWLQRYRITNKIYKHIWEIITSGTDIDTLIVGNHFLISLDWLNKNNLYIRKEKEIKYIQRNYIDLEQKGFGKLKNKQYKNLT